MRPKTALEHLQGTVFSAEALSRPARTAFFLPFSPCLRTPLVAFLFLSAAGALLSLALAVDKRVRPGKAREAKLLWLAAPSAPIALLHVGLKCDVRHSAAAEQAAGALLWFVLAAAKRVRPPSALDAKLFLLVAPWGPIAVYFPCSAPLLGARCVGKRARPGKALKTSKQSSERASQQASKPEPAKSRCQNKKKPGLAPQRRGRRHWAAALKFAAAGPQNGVLEMTPKTPVAEHCQNVKRYLSIKQLSIIGHPHSPPSLAHFGQEMVFNGSTNSLLPKHKSAQHILTLLHSMARDGPRDVWPIQIATHRDR